MAVSSSAALFSPVGASEACLEALPNVVITDAIGSSETGFTGLGFVSAGAKQRGGPRVTPGPSTIVIDDDGRPAGPARSAGSRAADTFRSATTRTRSRRRRLFVEVDGKRYDGARRLARVEADGTITLLGRGNTCVNTGGEKVFPEEVEGALKSHADVFDALVIGVPDECSGSGWPRWCSRARAGSVDLAELEATCARQIAGYKVPRSVWLVDAIGAAAERQGRLHMGAPLCGQPAGERGTPGGPRGIGGRRPSGGLRDGRRPGHAGG